MTLLLNYAHVILLVIALCFVYNFRKRPKALAYTALAYAAALFTLMAIGPSYLPKSDVERYNAPVFEATQDATVENNLREPELTSEEREAKAKELFDWKERTRKKENTDEHEPEKDSP